jgi:hypothetical protein
MDARGPLPAIAKHWRKILLGRTGDHLLDHLAADRRAQEFRFSGGTMSLSEVIAGRPPPSAATVDNLLTKLRSKFPAAFSIPPAPLAIGIFESIATKLHPRVTTYAWGLCGFRHSREGRKLSAALEQWTMSPTYLAACVAGAARVDLAGSPVGAVTAQEAEWAADTLRRSSRGEQSIKE